MTKGGESLRFFLRDGTRAAHEETDAAFGVLDLATEEGLGRFLCAHHRALSAIEPHLAAPGLPAPPRRLALIEADLFTLGRKAPPPLPEEIRLAHRPGALDPLGLAYVVAGSALGGRLLRRLWEQSETPAVKNARRYMGDESGSAYWVELQKHLSTIPESAQEAEALLASARSAFSLFLAALRA